MVGIGIIGTGYWGKNHARVCCELRSEGIVDAVKICDIDKRRAKEVSDMFGIEYVADYKDIVNDREIQAVSIVTPSSTHYELACEFIEAGMDVLIEKPMTMDVQESRELVKLAKEADCILMAGHIFRYHPAVRELKRRIDTGEFGTIQIILSNRLHLGLPRKDMGVTYALGIHELDMFCYLLHRDFPRSLTAVASNSFQPDIEETVMIAADFADGIKGYAMESWLVPVYGKMRDLVVIGSEKSAKIDYLNSQELQIFDTRLVIENDEPVRVENEGRHIIPIPYAEPLKEELKHFISCIKTRSKPVSDGMVGMRAVVMAESALKSSKMNKAVELVEGRYVL